MAVAAIAVTLAGGLVSLRDVLREKYGGYSYPRSAEIPGPTFMGHRIFQ